MPRYCRQDVISPLMMPAESRREPSHTLFSFLQRVRRLPMLLPAPCAMSARHAATCAFHAAAADAFRRHAITRRFALLRLISLSGRLAHTLRLRYMPCARAHELYFVAMPPPPMQSAAMYAAPAMFRDDVVIFR